MGMRIASNAGTDATQSTTIAQWQQKQQAYQQNFKALTSAVQSGNIAVAQTAYTALTAGQTPPANSPLAQLGQDIAAGSPAAAQQALQSLQTARAGHHHHGAARTDTASGSTPATPTVTANTAAGTSANGALGGLLNISA